jgi:uncharacterized lipoprotein YajG
MKKIIFILTGVALLAAGCAKVQLQQNVPSAPSASYQQLPQ